MNWEEIYHRLDHVMEYAVYIGEIKARSSGAFDGLRINQLPTFDYFYTNCVLDRVGSYDISKLRDLIF